MNSNLTLAPILVRPFDLSAKYFGAYENKAGNDVFHFRGHNIAGGPMHIDSSKVVSKMFGASTPAIRQSFIMELIAPAPADDGPYVTGFTAMDRLDYVGNDFHRFPRIKVFNGRINSIQSTVDGELADSDKLALLKDLIGNINADSTDGPIDPDGKNYFDASIMYVISNGDDTDNSTIVFTNDETGVSTTVTITSAQDLATQINDSVDYVRAYKYENVDKVIVLPRSGSGYFGVTEGTDTTIDNFYLKLTENDDNHNLRLEWGPDYDGHWEYFNRTFEFDVDCNITTQNTNGAMDLSLTVNSGTATLIDVTPNATLSTAIGNMITALLAEDDIACISVGNIVKVMLVAKDITSVILRKGTTADVTVSTTYGIHSLATLTGQDIFNKFPTETNMFPVYQHTPDIDTKYAVLALEFTSDSGSMDDVNTSSTRTNRMEFYLKVDDLNKDLWDSSDFSDETPTTKNRNFFDLLLEVFGSRPDGGSAGDDVDLDNLTDSNWNN